MSCRPALVYTATKIPAPKVWSTTRTIVVKAGEELRGLNALLQSSADNRA